MVITLEQFEAVFGKVKESSVIVDALNATMPRFNINTKDRVCAFLAQIGHESGNFVYRVENLNYSAKALTTVFKKYFPSLDVAMLYERKPEKIANKVYANRMGNGDELSGDGFRFRGRGYIQLTGKNNYIACGDSLGVNLVVDPAHLETVVGAVESACWFWNKNNLNALADKKDVKAITRAINGGFNGLEDRMMHYDRAQSIL